MEEDELRIITELILRRIDHGGIAITADTDLRYCGMSSLVFVQILMEIEDSFHIEIPLEMLSIKKHHTISQFYQLVEDCMKGYQNERCNN